MSKLLVKAPDIQPKATEYIPEMITLTNVNLFEFELLAFFHAVLLATAFNHCVH